MTIRKYNPGTGQSDAEIIRQFVVRQQQFQPAMEIIEDNINAPSNQHLLFIAPRGRGKTMMLTRIAAEIRQTEHLQQALLPVQFMEESLEILSIEDFWLECLFYLSIALKSEVPEYAKKIRDIQQELAADFDDKQLAQKAQAQVLKAADKIGRRLVLMLENLQDMAKGNQDFGWALRKALQNENRIIVTASATSRFHGLKQVDQPFFELFYEIDLPPLNTKECATLWKMLTDEEVGRDIKPLEILTGGSPRLLVITAGFAEHRSLNQLMEELIGLIDEHTEYFRSHLENLAPKERKVYIAVIDLWRPSFTAEIAARARMGVRETSSLLGRLINRGAVIETTGSRRNKQYAAAERLYSIFYKIRRERDEAAVVKGLIQFMAAFYSDNRLEALIPSLMDEAKEHDRIQLGFRLAYAEDNQIRQTMSPYIGYEQCLNILGDANVPAWLEAQLNRIDQLLDSEDYQEALVLIDQISSELPNTTNSNEEDFISLHGHRAFALGKMGDWKSAINSYTLAIAQVKKHMDLPGSYRNHAICLFGRGSAYLQINAIDQAINDYKELEEVIGSTSDEALQIIVAEGLLQLGLAYHKQHDTHESSKYLDQSTQSYRLLINRFTSIKDAEIQIIVATAHLYIGINSISQNDDTLTKKSLEFVVNNYSNYSQPEIKLIVFGALILISALYSELGDISAALDSYKAAIQSLDDQNSYVSQVNKLFIILVQHGINLDQLLPPLISHPQYKELFYPLVVALQLELGETVRAPQEVMAVAEDIRELIQASQKVAKDKAAKSTESSPE